jgi:hypothetical protein
VSGSPALQPTPSGMAASTASLVRHSTSRELVISSLPSSNSRVHGVLSQDLTDPNVSAAAAAAGSVSSLPGADPSSAAAAPAASARPHHVLAEAEGGDADLLFGVDSPLKFQPPPQQHQPQAVTKPVFSATAANASAASASASDLGLGLDAKHAAATAAANAAAASAAQHAASHTHLAHGPRRFQVSVSDPEKKGENYLSQHMTYKINTTVCCFARSFFIDSFDAIELWRVVVVSRRRRVRANSRSRVWCGVTTTLCGCTHNSPTNTRDV